VPSDAPYTDKDWPQTEKNYAAMVTRMDSDVGRIAALVKELGLDSNTLIIFTSDNGPCKTVSHDPEFFDSNGPFNGYKRDLLEGGIRVPLVARWPGKVPAGATSDQVWTFWDVLPTFAEIAGLPEPKDIDGISMLPTLLGKEQPESHDYLYWDYGHCREVYQQALRMDDWKGIRVGQNAPIALYDLNTDPGETRDVAQAHPDVVNQIEAHMKAAVTPSPDYPVGELYTMK
jgi:arylsulfatase A-like enzyme